MPALIAGWFYRGSHRRRERRLAVSLQANTFSIQRLTEAFRGLADVR